MNMRAAIDWDEVRARLDRVDAAVREALEPSPDRVKAVLQQRARALAIVPTGEPSASEMTDVVVFSMGGESYAVETRHVRRVVKPDSCTPVPGAPASLLGLINVSGDVLPVFDLASAFGLAVGTPCSGALIVVLGAGRDELGLAADAVHEVRSLRQAELLEPPGTIEGLGRHLILGLTADALLVLDGAALLKDDRMIIDQGEDLAGSTSWSIWDGKPG